MEIEKQERERIQREKDLRNERKRIFKEEIKRLYEKKMNAFQKYKQMIQKDIERSQKKQQEILAATRKEFVDAIVEHSHEWEITPEELTYRPYAITDPPTRESNLGYAMSQYINPRRLEFSKHMKRYKLFHHFEKSMK